MKISAIIIFISLSLSFITFTAKPITYPVEVPTEIVATESIEDITIAPTEYPAVDFSFDFTIRYKEYKDKQQLQDEIAYIQDYLSILNSLDYHIEIECEKVRVQKILDKYLYDLKYFDKIIRTVPKEILNAEGFRDFKSYEKYTNITSKNTPHYKLQQQYAYTGTYGIRMVDGRFCIAVGSYFTSAIGQYVDVILANGTVIPCIVGDQKSDSHTDEKYHVITSRGKHADGSIIEFIIDGKAFVSDKTGSLSGYGEGWDSPVTSIIVYNINIFK